MHDKFLDRLTAAYKPQSDFARGYLSNLATELISTREDGSFTSFWVTIWVAFPTEGGEKARKVGSMLWGLGR